MAIQRPCTREHFARIFGVEEFKLMRYGPVFIGDPQERTGTCRNNCGWGSGTACHEPRGMETPREAEPRLWTCESCPSARRATPAGPPATRPGCMRGFSQAQSSLNTTHMVTLLWRMVPNRPRVYQKKSFCPNPVVRESVFPTNGAHENQKTGERWLKVRGCLFMNPDQESPRDPGI